MGAPDLLQALQAKGLILQADGDRLLVTPTERITEEIRATIRANKVALLAALISPISRAPGSTVTVLAHPLGGIADMTEDLPWSATLTQPERYRLIALADAWKMEDEERAVMFRQCETGGQAVDGTKFTAGEARAFWLTQPVTVQ